MPWLRPVRFAVACSVPVALGGATATKVSDFEGVEEPELRYVVAEGRFVYDSYVNIRDVGEETVRFTLRYRAGEGWDGDRDRDDTSRQRTEVKGIGPHQKPGEVFEYATTWRTNPEFRPATRFCHVFQVKSTDGDSGPPLIVASILGQEGKAAVRLWSGDAKGFSVVREFAWSPGTWQQLRIRVKVSDGPDGEVLVSVDGDDWRGVTGVPVFRPGATDYRPKWGLYRGIDRERPMPMGDDWVEHRSARAAKVP
ncbi:MAG TPA: heparin lyase I family protein [Opitutaceae bacterium]|nr:heparin lyase I family protein [Opitutaceae bacterium]